mgnify:FL=1|jgi:hypothetical protein
MCEAHQEEIEFLRKNIENLSFSKDEINDTMSNGNKLNKKNIIYNKTGKKIFIEDSEENDIYENTSDNFLQKKLEISKIFDDIYDNIYSKDINYFFNERIKKFKEVHYDSIECQAGYFKKKKKHKFNINECLDMINSNGHQSRYEAIFEDEFISSDSYDTELFALKKNVKKEFEIKTNKHLAENKDNLNEIMKVLKIYHGKDTKK